MKKFYFKILIYVFLLSTTLYIIKSTVPFHWGNPELGHKIEYFLEKKYIKRISQQIEIEANVLFFGSSRTYRHIDPMLFDEVTGLNSFNLGGNATFYLETDYLIENILNNIKIRDTLRIFQQEIYPIDITDKNFHSLRSKYFFDYRRLKIAIIYFYNKKDFVQLYRHIVSYFENLLCIGEIREIYYYNSKIKKYQFKFFNFKMLQKGYWSMGYNLNEKVIPSHIYLQENEKNSKFKNIRISVIDNEHSKNNKMLFSYEIKKIKLEKKYYYDRGHFNLDGSRIFTKRLAKELLRKYQ